MSQHQDKEDIKQQDIMEEIQEEVELIEQQEDIIEEQAEEIAKDETEIAKLKDLLARNQADFENFKKRTERDKDDMMFFLKHDILKKILPRLDDLERIIKNTPSEMQSWVLYEWVITLQKTLLKDLEKLWVIPFESIWHPSQPEKHEVMTQAPGKLGVIIDEFEKGYMLRERVLRVAKVVVGSWE